jgi:hypothetical protein
MPRTPVLLVTCTRCHALHPPLRSDTAHPLCGRCAVPGAAGTSLRPRPRPRARSAGSR